MITNLTGLIDGVRTCVRGAADDWILRPAGADTNAAWYRPAYTEAATLGAEVNQFDGPSFEALQSRRVMTKVAAI